MFNKNKLEKEKEQEKDRQNKRNPWDSQPCGLCRAAKSSKKCPGHGGGGGGGGGSAGEATKGETNSMPVSAKPFGEMDANITPESIVNIRGNLVTADKAIPSQSDRYDIKFNLSFIAQLLANNDLIINNDKGNGCLTIAMNPNSFLRMSDDERKEFRQFITFIEQQFNDFKNNLENPADQNKCKCEVNNDPKDLITTPFVKITISDPSLYDNFIQHLTSAINRLSTENNKMSVQLITTHLQDQSKVTNEMREGARSEHQEFLNNQIKDTSPGIQQKSSKNTPLPTRPTPGGVSKKTPPVGE